MKTITAEELALSVTSLISVLLRILELSRPELEFDASRLRDIHSIASRELERLKQLMEAR